MTISAVGSDEKDNFIILRGGGDGFGVDGLEIIGNQINANVINIQATGGFSGFFFRNVLVDIWNNVTIGDVGTNKLMTKGAGVPEFLMSNVISNAPFDGNIEDFIDEGSSGYITIGGVSYVPNSDLQQVTQTAPTLPAQYSNKQYVDNSVLKKPSQTVATTSNLGFNVDNTFQSSITALAVALTIDAPTGSPVDGQEIRYRIKDNGVSRTIDWNTAGVFNNTGIAPASTTINKNTYVRAIYDANTSLYDIVETIVLT
jgi:hypothetical protein